LYLIAKNYITLELRRIYNESTIERGGNMMIKAKRIRIEHIKNPIGIDSKHPLISWNIEGEKVQKFYRVITKGNLGSNYDSGIVKSNDMQVRIPVDFKSRERIKVSVQVDSKLENIEEAYFEMGLNKNDWYAKWINPELEIPSENEQRPASYLCKKFKVEKNGQARIYITAHGIYNIYINKKHINEFVMAPGVSEYKTILQYQTYDITGYLKKGENEILVVLGNGWWRGTTTYDGIKNGFGRDVALLAQIEIDGKIICVTDESWEATQNGPLRDTDNMMGEIYDARKEILDGWHNVKVENYGYENLCCSNCPYPKEHEKFKPILIKTPKGESVLDFGQNIAGYISFEFESKDGEIYIFTHGETLDGKGNFCMSNFQSQNYYCAQEIKYICKEGINKYKVSNTFMGFRYVKVEGMKYIDPECFTSYAVYTDLEETSKFSCGNELVNNLFKNAMWSIKGNLLDIPTDCPTREKSGFTGDLLTYTHTMLYMMDCYPMMKKFVLNQKASQYEDGCLKQIVADPRKRGPMDGAAGWCDSFEVIPEKVGERYNDYRLFEDYYKEIKKWVNFLIKRAASGTKEKHKNNPYHEYLEDMGIHWGEWAEPGMMFESYIQNIFENGEPEVGTAYFSYACQLLSKQAKKMAQKYEDIDTNKYSFYKADSNYYTEIAEKAKMAYRYEYVKKGKINSERMCRYIRPISLNLLNDKEKIQAAKDLNEIIIKNNYKMNTGFLTTHELCRTLSTYGYIETAYNMLLNEETPGWLYSVKQGATTIPENWIAYQPDGSCKDSFNHYCYGAIAGWLMDTVAGIQVINGEIIINPHPSDKLNFVSAEYLSPLGKIVSSWKYTEIGVLYKIEIPCNSEAKVILPQMDENIIGPGVHEFLVRHKISK
jgi:alpha-L-rhamnosidase